MNAIAGNEPGYEVATRALVAGDLTRLRDLQNHALTLAEAALGKGK